ncbi:hypothetical protein [Martelella mediterranea]|uniref:GyrI-like small molecule binding protein n=1 Tax=Martelella mediterranea TaxID=293089 RepID=A0A4R3NWW3_9HYPH|nr:hypothetical protein [Martelella mediterranea]TCT44714.1 hypothetical protein EDC90_1002264 [Martelella mediterranea]
MKIVETDAFWALTEKRLLAIRDVKAAAAVLSPEIESEAAECGLAMAGPWVFTARNLPQDGKTRFDWTICYPVQKPEGYNHAGRFELVRFEPIMAATRTYQGTMRGLFTQGYAPLVEEIRFSRHDFSGESREIYHKWNGAKAGYHKIEIQFGLAR